MAQPRYQIPTGRQTLVDLSWHHDRCKSRFPQSVKLCQLSCQLSDMCQQTKVLGDNQTIKYGAQLERHLLDQIRTVRCTMDVMAAPCCVLTEFWVVVGQKNAESAYHKSSDTHDQE